LRIFPFVPSAITQGISYGLFIALSVGPTIFAIIKYSISYGHKAGFSYIFGVSVSDFLFVAMANLAANFLSVANAHQKLIGISGSLLLIGMGLYGYFKKLKIQRSADTIVPVGAGGLFKIAVSGFFMNTLNPSVFLFWFAWTAAITATASETNNPIFYRIIVFGTCLLFVLFTDLLKVSVAGKLRSKLTLQNMIIINRISGIIILLFSAALFYGALHY